MAADVVFFHDSLNQAISTWVTGELSKTLQNLLGVVSKLALRVNKTHSQSPFLDGCIPKWEVLFSGLS